MHRLRFMRALVGALAGLVPVAAPALAGSPYNGVFRGAGQAPGVTGTAAPEHRTGPFTCSFRETRTKLERKNCGGVRS